MEEYHCVVDRGDNTSCLNSLIPSTSTTLFGDTLEVTCVSALCKMGTNVCHPDSIPSVSTDGEGLRHPGFKSSCLENPCRAS